MILVRLRFFFLVEAMLASLQMFKESENDGHDDKCCYDDQINQASLKFRDVSDEATTPTKKKKEKRASQQSSEAGGQPASSSRKQDQQQGTQTHGRMLFFDTLSAGEHHEYVLVRTSVKHCPIRWHSFAPSLVDQ